MLFSGRAYPRQAQGRQDFKYCGPGENSGDKHGCPGARRSKVRRGRGGRRHVAGRESSVQECRWENIKTTDFEIEEWHADLPLEENNRLITNSMCQYILAGMYSLFGKSGKLVGNLKINQVYNFASNKRDEDRLHKGSRYKHEVISQPKVQNTKESLRT